MIKRSDYFSNTEGLNLTDSPLFVKNEQATGGYNYDYTKTGGITKIRGISKINTVADAQLKTIGLGVHDTKDGAKTVIRAAGTKLQIFNTSTGVFSNLSSDQATPTSDFLLSTTNQPVVSTGFNTQITDMLWLAGGGMDLPHGFNGSTITTNGSAAPTGTFTAANQGSATGGSWGVALGVYWYTLVLRKASTQALSNADLDKSVTIATATDSVLLTFPTDVDTTLYDMWYIYRSSLAGVEDFTAGNLVAQVATTTPTYTDTNVTIASSQVVPRAGNLALDNSTLPDGTYNYITSFKRRLVAVSKSTIYISDLDKPESWPIGLRIPIQTGGPITGVSVIGYNSPSTGSTDEYLLIFKSRETWIIDGTVALDPDTSIYDVELKFIDSVGCVAQPLVVRVNGFVVWMDYRGIYMWSGVDKPVYVSRPIEALFQPDGDLDKTKLSSGWGYFLRDKNQVVWTVSHRIKGQNKVQIKLDLRLTTPKMQTTISGNNVIDGVFNMDSYTTPLYAGVSLLQSTGVEQGLAGDALGFIYKTYYSGSDNGSGIKFNYITKAFDQDMPTVAKRYLKVVVYVDEAPPQDLTLKYWADYRVLTAERSEISLPMQKPNAQGLAASLWDLALWDVAIWDEYNLGITPLTFNLSSDEGNNEGDSIQLCFEQLQASAPVTINGFSIYWEDISTRK